MLYFISKDVTWQKYRNDALIKLKNYYHLSVKILTTGSLKNYIVGNDEVEYFFFRSWFPRNWKFSFFPGALVYIIQKRPDVILCVTNLSQFTELAALFLSRLLGIRFVWWTHGYEHGSPKAWELKKLVWSLLYKYADNIITFSQQGRDYLIGMGINDKKVFCAPNTLDTDRLRMLAKETEMSYTREALANELGFSLNDRILLYSGRLTSRKKVEYAIMAVNRIVERFPEINFVIIGDGPERDNLKTLAGSLIPGRCHFWGSVYDERKLANVFVLADLFLMPCSVGLAIVHAFCFGLPIITERSNFHGPEFQYFREGYNGLLYDKDNIDDFAEKIDQLLADNEMRATMSANAIKTAEEEASIQNMITQMGLALGLENAAS